MKLKPINTKALRLAIAAAMLLGVDYAHASITYDVNQTIGQGSVIGSITTSGITGILHASNIENWNLQLNGDGASVTLTNFNSDLTVVNDYLTATPTALSFNFDGAGSGYMLFQAMGGANGQSYYCNATSLGTCFQGASVVPLFYTDTSSQFATASGNIIIGTVSSVPVPSAVWLFGTGLFGLLGSKRRK
jgi:hypothetical protein